MKSKSIAVLPFKNLSANQEAEYFADGITDEIINSLSKIQELKVISRTSSFTFKETDLTLSEIAKQLGVSIILEGSIRLSGTAIRVNARLIEAAEDFQFWSETFDRKLENVFDIQDEISLIQLDASTVNPDKNFSNLLFGDIRRNLKRGEWEFRQIEQAIEVVENNLFIRL